MQTARRSYQSSTSPDALNLHLHPRQWAAFETKATEVLYGGASGGAVGAPFDARANLKAVLCDLKADVALLARLERATIKI